MARSIFDSIAEIGISDWGAHRTKNIHLNDFCNLGQLIVILMLIITKQVALGPWQFIFCLSIEITNFFSLISKMT